MLAATKTGKRIQRIGNETMDLFKRYSWPGNVRELQNVIERALLFLRSRLLFCPPLPLRVTDSLPRFRRHRPALGSLEGSRLVPPST